MLILPSRGTSPEKFKQHAFSHSWLDQPEMFYKDHPVCPRCESIALRDNGWATERMARCPKCGWSGKALTLFETYTKEQLYRR